MPTPCEKEMEHLRKLLAEVETDEDSGFDNEDNGPEDDLERIFQIMKVSAKMIRNDKRTEILKVNNSEEFLSKDGVQWRKTKFRQNIVSRLPGERRDKPCEELGVIHRR
ncbi:hypothetical protein AVEN_107118-1 [Araneus ventricosus]|uniref:Uncharacterized protein n=1 Tax=Araneus ventricosus TaxID=182803 RepID=A0A4Y2IWZ1_ARAVE|nr:hypothetical protein AVEN_107118-1 [Araneus ventricosus]